MKYGIHLSTYTQSWGEDVLQYIKTSKEFGYDGVEFPLMDPFSFNIEKAKQLLNEYSMEATCGTGLNENRDISSSDEKIREKGMRHLKKCIDICHDLGSDCLGGVLYAPWGQYKNRDQAQDNIKRSLENLRILGHYAKERQVVLALEMINRYETYFLNTVEEGIAYLEEINHPNIKLHFDTYHANIEEKDMKRSLQSGGDAIYHVHVSENDRGIPGSGHIDWHRVKEGLQDIDYNRWITVENFVIANCEVGRDTFTWRNIERDGHHVAEKSIKFLKQLFRDTL